MEQTARINRRKKKQGVVVSNKMNKTVVVQLETTELHPRYGKVITRKKKIYAHTDDGNHNVGDVVEVVETRPLSKLKRWRVVQKG